MRFHFLDRHFRSETAIYSVSFIVYMKTFLEQLVHPMCVFSHSALHESCAHHMRMHPPISASFSLPLSLELNANDKKYADVETPVISVDHLAHT
jgi:hypothetical protein